VEAQVGARQEDPAYAVSLARKGSEPVPADRHPSFMPDGARFATIERKGMVLMERPLELTEEAREIEAQACARTGSAEGAAVEFSPGRAVRAQQQGQLAGEGRPLVRGDGNPREVARFLRRTLERLDFAALFG
jgi:hypothetical protein